MIAGMPFLQGLSLNGRVVAFAALLAVLGASLFTLAPFLSSSLNNLRQGLTEGSRGSSGTAWRRLGSNLVVAELAIAVILLVAAGLLGKSLYRLLHVELGFRPDHLATFEIAAPEGQYAKPEQQVALAHQVTARLEALPSVKSAAFVSVLPVSCNCNTNWIRVVGKPYSGEHNEVNDRDVSPNYFSTVQAKLLRGRYFEASDDLTKPKYTIINEAFAKKYFPEEDPIGKQIGDNQLTPKSLRQVIGVVPDIKDAGLDAETWPAEYESLEQEPDTNYVVVVRTATDPAPLLPSLVSAVRQVDSGIGVLNELTMEARITNSPAAYLHRSSSRLVAGFAAVALVLGVIGLYGVIAYSVSQRTREIGVRMALGAEKASVYRLILKEAGALIAVGIVIGVVCSIGAANLMHSLLFGVRGWDIPTLAGVTVTLATCALLASVVPAHRAASVDPAEALRAE
jgi:predicted permease